MLGDEAGESGLGERWWMIASGGEWAAKKDADAEVFLETAYI
jgi:hypothetical protein